MPLRAPLAAALLLACAAVPAHAQQNEPDTERRLETVSVFTLAPHIGQLHVNPVILREPDYQRPGYEHVDLVFAPVTRTASGIEAALDEGERDRFRIRTRLPERPEGLPFIDTHRDYATQSTLLPSGAYALTSVTFSGAPGMPDAAYCLANGSFVFDILGRDLMFMGVLNLAYPPNDPALRATHNPVKALSSHPKALNGWRQTVNDVLVFAVDPVTFTPDDSLCPQDSHVVSALSPQIPPRS